MKARTRISRWITFLQLAVLAALAGTPIALPEHALARGPYTGSDLKAVENGDEQKLRDIRDQEINQLRITLGRRLPNNRRADLYFRLAELYFEAYNSTFLSEGRIHEKKLERGEEDRTIDRTLSKPFLMKGIEACKEIISYRIPYEKLDQVYYFLGFNYTELGNRAEALRYFDHLTRHFPQSPFAIEAYREMGDASFESANYKKAQAYYEIASRKVSAELQPRILHKLAWSYYRTKQYDRAVSTMKEAIGRSKSGDQKTLLLREEALRDMALFMTETGKVDEAIAYFREVADDTYYPRALERLGKQFERNVETDKATKVYESLVRTHPNSESSFRILVKLVDLDLRRERYKEALARVASLDGRDIPRTEHDTQVAAQNLRAMVRRTATEHHEKWRKNQTKPDLEIAELYYTGYVRHFLVKDDPRQEIPEIQMYLAEVKRDLGKSTEASQLYRKVLDSKDKRYAKEAGALWTASLGEAIKRSTKAAPQASGGKEPSAMEREYVAATDKMQEALGDTNEGREAALRAAQVLAGYRSTQEEAIERIKKLVERKPRSAQALTAARLQVQILSDNASQKGAPTDLDDLKGAMKELRENAALMQADQELGGGKLRASLTEQDTQLRIKDIAREEGDKDFDDAGKGYESLANDTTQRDLAEKAYANAVTSFLKSRKDESSQAVDRVTAQWVKRFPKSPKATESIRSAATGYLIEGDFAFAAKLFERLGRDGADADSLLTAARLYEGNGDVGRAQAAWGLFLELYKSNPQRSEVTLTLARSQEAQAQDSAANRSYSACMTGSHEYEAECGARLGDLFMRNRDVAQAKAHYAKVAAMKPKGKGDAMSPFVGYARFKLAEFKEKEGRFDALRMPEDKLRKSVSQRMEFLEPLSRAYNSAGEVGGPWAVSALYRLASWVMRFADEVDQIEPTSSKGEKLTDPAAIERFRKSLAGVSGPLRAKAVSTWSDAYAKAVDSEVFSTDLPELGDALAGAGAARPGRAQGFRGKFRIAGVAIDGGEEGKSGALKRVREKLAKSPTDPSAWVDYGNLLWGQGKPLLAKLSYERALGLKPRHPAATNNRAVILLTGSQSAQEDWLIAPEANEAFRQVLAEDSFFTAAKFNRAALLSYYRLFPKSLPLWEQVKVRGTGAEVEDGHAIALQGSGDVAAAQAAFERGREAGGAKSRFAAVYHEAARLLSQKKGEDCVDRLDDADAQSVAGFEKSAIERLKALCTRAGGKK